MMILFAAAAAVIIATIGIVWGFGVVVAVEDDGFKIYNYTERLADNVTITMYYDEPIEQMSMEEKKKEKNNDKEEEDDDDDE